MQNLLRHQNNNSFPVLFKTLDFRHNKDDLSFLIFWTKMSGQNLIYSVIHPDLIFCTGHPHFMHQNMITDYYLNNLFHTSFKNISIIYLFCVILTDIIIIVIHMFYIYQ